MKNILSQASREVLEQFVASNALFAFDFDGTLAPIVARPDRARMRLRTRSLLATLTRLAPVIVISGRARSDALERIEGVPVLEVIGSHGVDPRHATDRYRAEVQRWVPALERAIAPYGGVAVEDKIFSIAVHYRKARAKGAARAAILRTVADLGSARVVGGKQVVNVLPSGAPHKGGALLQERDRLGCHTAIYIGDDETDEDVFELDQPGRLLTIRVGVKRSSAASYSLASQRAIDPLLRTIVQLRRRAQQAAPARRDRTK